MDMHIFSQLTNAHEKKYCIIVIAKNGSVIATFSDDKVDTVAAWSLAEIRVRNNEFHSVELFGLTKEEALKCV